ncbi:MAG: hypothetical protein J6C81_01180 [Muribaculaceae bacterium]|nr:hypothetical protein [Muribaculaceae bacterium]
MADIRIAGVMRSGIYSPNHVGNDAAIITDVAKQLRKRGCSVTLYSETQFQETDIKEDVILSMAREEASILKLQRLEKLGKLVINSGNGISNSVREVMARLLMNADIPYPDSIIVDTNENIVKELEKLGINNCWVKRGESYSLHKEDVTYCRHRAEAQDMLHEYFYRGIRRAVINRHLEGDLVKFYGVRGRNYFYWFYPYYGYRERYGLDWVDDDRDREKSKFDVEALINYCERACEEMEIEIYGGDCIVDNEGNFQIIDFNDWPSFSPCCKEAARAIAGYVLNRIKN